MRALLIAILLAIAPAAYAQGTPGYGPPVRPNYGFGYRPGLSPYLNLLRGGDPSANYFLGTVPEFQRRANAAAFRDRVGALEGRVDDTDRVILSGTPPIANSMQRYFNNTGGYFPAPARPRQGR